MKQERIIIVGGVAGGASCAARARRLNESAEIIMFDRGSHVSFANCGLPYYVGDVIKDEENLLLATPERFRQRFNIDVRLNSEVQTIDRRNRELEIKDLETGQTYQEVYDKLLLAPGAQPIRPSIPGIDLPGIFSLRTIPDSRQIKAWIRDQQAQRAVIVGGGYIGMEMTENLLKMGLVVTLVEKEASLMPLLDPEVIAPLHEELIRNRVDLRLKDAVVGFEARKEHVLGVNLESGDTVKADVIILAIGVKPENRLALSAGLEVGERGGLRVNDRMQTSDPHIWAVGDAVEVKDVGTGSWSVIPLAGPANRQGRIAADVMMGRDVRFRGVQGTSVVGILDLVVAFTGPSEKSLKRLGLWDRQRPSFYEKIYLFPGHHAGYYPGANPITLKLIFRRDDGRVVSAQAIGKEGVEKRIDVISMAIQQQATVFDLEEAELCYAPQFGSAKDPVNIAGMIAANVIRGDAPIVHWDDHERIKPIMLDVRDPLEYNRDHIPEALNIPLDELRSRMDEVPRNQEVWVYCAIGQRSYYAARALSQYGFNIKNISGGFKTYSLIESLDYIS